MITVCHVGLIWVSIYPLEICHKDNNIPLNSVSILGFFLLKEKYLIKFDKKFDISVFQEINAEDNI